MTFRLRAEADRLGIAYPPAASKAAVRALIEAGPVDVATEEAATASTATDAPPAQPEKGDAQ